VTLADADRESGALERARATTRTTADD